MDLNPYKPITIDQFRGLYLRGMADECPSDHSPDCFNMNLSKRGECASRFGTSLSLNLNHLALRFFASATSQGISILTCDANGNIYKDTGSSPLLTISGMTDFAAVNLFDKTFINPIITSSPYQSSLYVWKGGTHVPRKAAGYAPTSSFSAAAGAAGHTGPGVYKIAVCFITDTGFTTPPGPIIASVFTPVSVTMDGAHKISVTGIPTGGAEVVARQLLVTQGDLDLYYYIDAGYINDNTTTTATLDFYDTDLAVSADDLFDLLPEIPCGGSFYCGLQKYRGRLLVWDDVSKRDLVYVSNVDDAESFNSVTGYIQLPSEQDGNFVAGAFTIQDVLYLTKSVGIFSTQDNAGDPNTWPITPVDGTCGAGHFGIGTVIATQLPLTMDNIGLLCNYGGIYAFNGSVIEPPLTYKIQDLWNAIFRSASDGILNASISIDPFNQVFYVLVPVNTDAFPNILLAAYYGEGLDAANIKWTRICLPNPVTAIGMLGFEDVDGAADNFYYLRLACSDGKLYKLHNGYLSDSGVAIDSHYQTGYVSVSPGGLNVYSALRARTVGSGSMSLKLYTEDQARSAAPPSFTLATKPGLELFRQVNFTGEKVSVKFGTYAVGAGFQMQRLDVFGKNLFPTRPQNGSGG